MMQTHSCTRLITTIRPLNIFFQAIVIVLSIFLLVCSAADNVAARDLPTCEGNNLVEKLKTRDEGAYEDLIRQAELEINSDGVFWKISRSGVAPSYLLGTVHSTDPRITTLPPAAKDALENARTVAVELADLNPAKVQAIIRKQPQLFFSLKGTKLNTVLSGDDYNVLLNEARKNGLQEALIPMLQPWFASISFFGVPTCERLRIKGNMDVLDKLIVTWGKKAGAEIVSLETLEEQYQAFASIPYNDQITLLENGIHTRALLSDMYATTLQSYLNRNIGVIMPLSLAYSRDRVKSLSADASFREVMIDKRNQVMFRRSQPLVNKGRSFIAVGALHLNGRMGLVELYRQAGYTVEKIY